MTAQYTLTAPTTQMLEAAHAARAIQNGYETANPVTVLARDFTDTQAALNALLAGYISEANDFNRYISDARRSGAPALDYAGPSPVSYVTLLIHVDISVHGASIRESEDYIQTAAARAHQSKAQTITEDHPLYGLAAHEQTRLLVVVSHDHLDENLIEGDHSYTLAVDRAREEVENAISDTVYTNSIAYVLQRTPGK